MENALRVTPMQIPTNGLKGAAINFHAQSNKCEFDDPDLIWPSISDGWAREEGCGKTLKELNIEADGGF
ncbi:hypothetical protein TNCT_228151 [Trichonephila clavata]|uniref:Uncharacterized protein n=1 Tax=Trichonephila clavata TaxID=2740835 RepID=A0A8X6J6L9_TRICU|nr:hypothetical protein TNCT_228151 [Trichonephila clavata]